MLRGQGNVEPKIDVWREEDDDRKFLDIYGEGVTEEDVVNAAAATARGDLEVRASVRRK